MGSVCVQKICRKVLRKKNFNEAQSMSTPLNRCLSIWHLVFYGMAHMAGAGVYVLSGTIVKNYAGPAGCLSFLSCSVASIFTGLCYVEFASLVPRAGSSYTYTYCVLGELPAFIVGWTMLLDYILGMASVAKAFSGTVDSLSRRQVSKFLTAKLGRPPKWWGLDDTWDLPAVALILLLALLVLGGAKLSLSVNAVLSSLQLLCLITITVASFCYGSLENWTAAGFFPFGASGILEGASIAMFAFAGFECIGAAAEECREPKRDLPRALLGSLVAVSVLYVAATLGVSFLQPFWKLDLAAPFVAGFAEKPNAKWAEITAAVGTLLATGATKVSGLFVIPRIMYALASDGIIWSAFASVNEGVQVPLLGLAFGAVVSSCLALIFHLKFLAEMLSMGTLLSYCVIGVDLFVLRYLHFAGSGPASAVAMRPWATGLARRLPQLARVRALRGLFVAYILACFVLAWGFECVARLADFWWRWFLLAPPALLLLLLGAALSAYRPHDVSGMYNSPALPLAPLMAVLVNAVMLTRLSVFTWLRFLVWMFLGLLIYALYGLSNSKARGHSNSDEDESKEADTDTSTADDGAPEAPPAVSGKQENVKMVPPLQHPDGDELAKKKQESLTEIDDAWKVAR